jgi:hypothetical protein
MVINAANEIPTIIPKDPFQGHRRCSGQAVPALQNFLGVAIFSSAAHATVILRGVLVARRSAVVTDLQTKVLKYEAKAAQYEESARQARDERERAFYEVLAGYYIGLATDFRQVIEKRKAG